jgi:nucleoside phosphorylase
MTSELAPIKKSLGIGLRPRSGEVYCTGTYKGVTVITAVTNMGLAASQSATEALFDHYGDSIDHLFVVGVAGAYDQRLKIGEVVIPESVVDHRDGIVRYPANLGTREPSGLLYSSDQLSYSEDYVALLNSKNVTAVDMESGAITAVCQRHGCPVTIVRAVSDRVDVLAESYDVFHLARTDGSPKYLAALRFVLRRPQRIAYLVSLGLGAKKAIDAATAELLKNIEALLDRTSEAEATANVASA